MGTENFRKNVLKGKKAFGGLFSRNRKCRAEGISLVYGRNSGNERPRVAVCITRGSGNAVVRNRLKRITREAVDASIPYLRASGDLAFMPRKEFLLMNPEERQKAVVNLLKTAGLLDEDYK